MRVAIKNGVITFLLLLLVTLVYSLNTLAQQPVFTEITEEEAARIDKKNNEVGYQIAFIYPKILQDRGIKKVGAIDLGELSKRFKKVKVRIFSLGFMIGGTEDSGSERTGAIFLTKDKTVIINSYAIDNMKNDMHAIELLFLHEFLGAAGYNDDHYQISIPIAMLGKQMLTAPKIAEREKPQAVLPKDATKFPLINISLTVALNDIKYRKNNVVRSRGGEGGGSTGVGGGGDGPPAAFKQFVIETYLESEKDPRVQKALIDMQIEYTRGHEDKNDLQVVDHKERPSFIVSQAFFTWDRYQDPKYRDPMAKNIYEEVVKWVQSR